MDENTNSNSIDLHTAFLDAVKRADFNDLQDELSGRVTGRMQRFLSADQREERDAKKDGRSHHGTAMSRLQILLASNPAYAKLYNDTFDALREAERAAERAIEQATAALEKAQSMLQDTLDRAARLPNGTRVFKDARGQIWSEHGTQISEEEAAAIHWRGVEPAYQVFLEEREAVEGRFTQLEALQGIQVDLGGIRHRMMDEDSPPSEERLHEYKKQIDHSMAQTQRREWDEPADNLAATSVPTAKLAIPDM